MQSKDQPKKLSLGAIAGMAAAEAIIKQSEADRRKAERVRKKAMIETAKYDGIAAALGINVRETAGQIKEAVPRVIPLLEEINERLKRIEEKLNS